MADEIPTEWLFPPSLDGAADIQRDMAARVVAEDALGPVRRLAGADISHNPRDPEGIVYAAMVTLALPALAPDGEAGAIDRARFPDVPGFLGFREVPSLVEAYRRLPDPPDLIFVDGHGLSHPRGLGTASHLGVVLDRPTIGVAKRILVGRPAGELGEEPGDHVPLQWRGRTIGAVVRTKRRTNPVYVSVGHRISLPTAINWVMRAAGGYRLPEPTRLAHLAANALRRLPPGP
ncbi:MAG TPA: endonuclease V [Alphaproteobacteria bacterium]|nr:endonuclease V [Alphaproteobacteria bacterium]